ncbi:uncharacterized protein PADG_12379 [Paracoccidioides brasiliensis Pb18]|uniref:Uncharacterized protein n=1 Tax=Paracoccidioides brasiliensis (strain Pb18) TaxID=502780 RepID=A0A0A0HU30_PARBD|nr:uncharacterized protein PADG_12379 [Paracoccidioides brasiliensis Pb18]KGM91521.1 hypothetical protein PADG_12379 [Paracoccidioides brasiliensis Pb18]
MRHGAIYCIVFIVNINININIRLNVSASTDTIHITSIPQETSARVTTGAATSRRQEEGLRVCLTRGEEDEDRNPCKPATARSLELGWDWEKSGEEEREL